MIKTINEIEIVIDPIKKTTYSTFLYGEIIRPIWGRDYESLGVEYIYFYNNEEGQKIIVKEGLITLVQQQIDALATSIDHKADGKCASEKKLHYSAFKILMSQNYSIPLSDIELI